MDYLEKDEAMDGTRRLREVMAKRTEELFAVGDVELHRDCRRSERRQRSHGNGFFFREQRVRTYLYDWIEAHTFGL